MSKTLAQIAEQLKAAKQKVQLIYAFNGTGKTRLSREFKELLSPRTEDEDTHHSELSSKKILYYSAFTEDLFYWDNDLEFDVEPKLLIRPNSFTRWVLGEQGLTGGLGAGVAVWRQEKVAAQAACSVVLVGNTWVCIAKAMRFMRA